MIGVGHWGWRFSGLGSVGGSGVSEGVRGVLIFGSQVFGDGLLPLYRGVCWAKDGLFRFSERIVGSDSKVSIPEVRLFERIVGNDLKASIPKVRLLERIVGGRCKTSIRQG